jgi:hypothetical protein
LSPYSDVKAFGFKKFPIKFQTINNISSSSELIIGGLELKELKPKTIKKTKTYE